MPEEDHNAARIDADLDAIEIEGDEGPSEPHPSKITTFGSHARAADKWERQPNVTGQGAVHFKLFHAKLREDALEYMEQQVNRWLDDHPECEVKFSSLTVGHLKTKISDEPALFLSLWV